MIAVSFQNVTAIVLRILFPMVTGTLVFGVLCMIGAHFMTDMSGIDWDSFEDDSEMGEAVRRMVEFTWLRSGGMRMIFLAIAVSLTCLWAGVTVLAVTAFFIEDENALSNRALSEVCVRYVLVFVLASASGSYLFMQSNHDAKELFRRPFETIQEMIEEAGE